MKKLTKLQQRVAIMRDVIQQLNAEQIIACAGTYLSTERHGVLDQDALKMKHAKPCYVCALGAVFLGAVRRFDEFTGAFSYVGPSDMRDHLSKFFSREQLTQLEALFEGFYSDGERERKGLVAFYYLGSRVRLLFICKQIIKAQGKFHIRALEQAASLFGKREQRKRNARRLKGNE